LIRYNLKELIEKKSLVDSRRISAAEIANEIGIQRSAMAKMIRDEGYNTTTKTLEALCRYFECDIGELIWFDQDQPRQN
tara:strand:+ start:91 stop:327 length:237 start_codon:yes stop_codon:yes gene_type:complete